MLKDLENYLNVYSGPRMGCDYLEDSRGNPLEIGDVVIMINNYVATVASIKEKYGRQQLHVYPYNRIYYDNQTILIKYDLDKYTKLRNLTHDDYSINIDEPLISLDFDYITNRISYYFRMDNNVSNIRNMKIFDFNFSGYKLGDLALCWVDGHFVFGLIISDKKCYCLDLKTHSTHFIISLGQLTDKEKKLQAYLVKRFHMQAKGNTSDDISSIIGGVFRCKDDNSIYLNLGKRVVSLKNKCPVDIIVSCAYEGSKGLWYKFYNVNYDEITKLVSGNINDILKLIELKLTNMKLDITYYKVNSDFYAHCQELISIPGLLYDYEVPKSMEYLSKISLPDSIVLFNESVKNKDMQEYSSISDIRISFNKK